MWATRTARAIATPLKLSTNITGLEVHSSPLPALKALYTSTLHMVGSQLPSSSVYRQGVEALTKARMGVVEKALGATGSQLGSGGQGDIAAVEKELGKMVEVLIEEAKGELQLAGKMGEWAAHEPLEHAAPAGQWRYFEPGTDTEEDGGVPPAGSGGH